MIEKHLLDEMTPVERRKAIQSGKPFDRFPCIPAMGEFKTQISHVSIYDMWHDSEKLAAMELAAFQRFGHDQLMIGPNSYGIADALGAEVKYPLQQLPYIQRPSLDTLDKVRALEPVDLRKKPRIQMFFQAAAILEKEAVSVVPVVASAGGPMTIASYLRGVEALLRDCYKAPKEVHHLLRVVTETEKSSIRAMAEYGLGTAFADPVANPELLGPRYYKEFAFPYMKELTDYAYEVSGRKPTLHMCGKTYRIWEYFRQFQIDSISLDNLIDLSRARDELSDVLRIAGNVPPVDVIMCGDKEDIFESVKQCFAIGRQMKKGYVLCSGCEIPYGTDPQKVDWFMEAARIYGRWEEKDRERNSNGRDQRFSLYL